MMDEGTYTPRPWAQPQLPWGTLHNPRFVQTQHGNKLLTDGWYRFGRKIHYTGASGLPRMIDVLLAASLLCVLRYRE